MKDYLSSSPGYLRAMDQEPALWEIGGGYDHPQPGSRLLQYGMGWMASKKRNPSAIYASYLQGGTPLPMHTTAATWLLKSGIKRLIVGHQPHGDAPWISEQHGIQVICADNAYSRNTQWPVRYLTTGQVEPVVVGKREEYSNVSSFFNQTDSSSTRSDIAFTEVLVRFPSASSGNSSSLPLGELPLS
jgi:hypothetical protein